MRIRPVLAALAWLLASGCDENLHNHGINSCRLAELSVTYAD